MKMTNTATLQYVSSSIPQEYHALVADNISNILAVIVQESNV